MVEYTLTEIIEGDNPRIIKERTNCFTKKIVDEGGVVLSVKGMQRSFVDLGYDDTGGVDKNIPLSMNRYDILVVYKISAEKADKVVTFSD